MERRKLEVLGKLLQELEKHAGTRYAVRVEEVQHFVYQLLGQIVLAEADLVTGVDEVKLVGDSDPGIKPDDLD